LIDVAETLNVLIRVTSPTWLL